MRLNRHQVFEIRKLSGCENYIRKRQKFVLNALIKLETVKG